MLNVAGGTMFSKYYWGGHRRGGGHKGDTEDTDREHRGLRGKKIDDRL